MKKNYHYLLGKKGFVNIHPFSNQWNTPTIEFGYFNGGNYIILTLGMSILCFHIDIGKRFNRKKL